MYGGTDRKLWRDVTAKINDGGTDQQPPGIAMPMLQYSTLTSAGLPPTCSQCDIATHRFATAV